MVLQFGRKSTNSQNVKNSYVFSVDKCIWFEFQRWNLCIDSKLNYFFQSCNINSIIVKLCEKKHFLIVFEYLTITLSPSNLLLRFGHTCLYMYIDVPFHVQKEISGQTKDSIQDVIETVAVIHDCRIADILPNGVYQHCFYFFY